MARAFILLLVVFLPQAKTTIYSSDKQDENPNFTLITNDGSPGRGFGLVTYKKGTICKHSDFNQREATAICKSMGYNLGALKWWSMSDLAGLFLDHDFSITMAQVSCSSENWSECYFSNRTEDCSHEDNLILNCAKSIPAFKQCSPQFTRSSEFLQSDLLTWKPYIDDLDCLSWCYMYDECKTALIGPTNEKCYILKVPVMGNDTQWRAALKGNCNKIKSITITPQTFGMIGGVILMLLAIILYFYIVRKCTPPTYETGELSSPNRTSSSRLDSERTARRLKRTKRRQTADVAVQSEEEISTFGDSHSTHPPLLQVLGTDDAVLSPAQETENAMLNLENGKDMINLETDSDVPNLEPGNVLLTLETSNAMINLPLYEDRDILPCPTYDEVVSAASISNA